LKIAVDVMSGDYPPEVLIEGAIKAVNEDNAQIVLVGDRNIIEKKLSLMKFKQSLVEIEHASQIIGMDEDPIKGFRGKKDSSVVKAAMLAKEGKVNGYFSPGNTGATLTTGLMINGRLKGIARPALAVVLPTINQQPCVLLDIGANPECNALNFLQFAVMGEVMVKKTFKIEKPTIGLLNIGEEDSKGTEHLKKVNKLMKHIGFDFVGNVESKMILEGKVNVIVADGFVGNVVLKTIEGTFKGLVKIATKEVKKSIFYQTGALLMKAALMNIKKRVAAEEYGASPLLGLNSVAMVGHGNSRQRDVQSGIRMTRHFVENEISDHIIEAIKQYGVGRLHYPFWAKMIGEVISEQSE